MTVLMSTRLVGTPVPRVDAVAKVSGAARFVDDLPADGVLIGRTVRSDVAHGVLRAVRLDPQFDWTDVVVATAADIPGQNCILLDTDDQPCLVAIGDRIRHAAEPVALVAAPTRERASAAAAHIDLAIEPLPPILTIDQALTEPSDLLAEFHLGHGDVDSALEMAGVVVVTGEYRTGSAEHAYIETQGMIARWDDGGRLHVVGSLQCPYYVLRALETAFAVAPGMVEVTQATTGGGFGGKEEFPSGVAAHAALLALRARRPVKMVYERGEDIAASTKRHPSRIHHRLAATRDGRLLAADIEVVLDGGAYVTLSPVVLLRAMLHATGPYRIPNVRVHGRVVRTNHVPSGAFRGFGAPQATFAAERQIAKLCRELGADPVAFRRANALRSGDTTSTGGTLDASAGLGEVLDALSARLAEPPAQARPAAGRNVRRGRGIAAAFHGAGFTGDGERRMASEAAVQLVAGGTFRVLTSCVDMGQGARTVLAQIAADALGVDLSSVDVPEPSTAEVPNTGPTVASRTTLVAGAAVQRAAATLSEQLRTWARANGLAIEDMAAVAGARAAAGDPPTATATYELPEDVMWDQQTLTGDAYPTYSWSATAVEVAVDDDTSEVTVERCIQVVDAGHAINPLAVEGQIHGGTLQALGWALLEHVDRPGGTLPAPSLSTTIIPTVMDAPEMEAVIVEVPSNAGPSGAKGIGELPLDGPAAAVANAVAAALDIAVDEIPLLPEVIHRLRGGAR